MDGKMKKIFFSIVLICLMGCIGCSYKAKDGSVWEFDMSNLTNPFPRDGAYYEVDEAIVARIDDRFLITDNKNHWYDVYPPFPGEKLLDDGEFIKIEGKMAYYSDVKAIFVQKIEDYSYSAFKDLKKERYISKFDSYAEDDVEGIYYYDNTDYHIYKFSNGVYAVYEEDILLKEFYIFEDTMAFLENLDG